MNITRATMTDVGVFNKLFYKLYTNVFFLFLDSSDFIQIFCSTPNHVYKIRKLF